MYSIRKELKKDTYSYEDIKDDNNDFNFTNSDNFVSESEVLGTLDVLENDINNIKDRLEEIKGLREIDEILEMVNELSKQLY